jgi:hypothetical protein
LKQVLTAQGDPDFLARLRQAGNPASLDSLPLRYAPAGNDDEASRIDLKRLS